MAIIRKKFSCYENIISERTVKFAGDIPVCALTAVRSSGSLPKAQTYRHSG
nr:MAG TPA: hypothetical protein [Caudoviricetes sp.]